MAFLLSTAFIVIGMGWFAFGSMAGTPAPRSPVWARCLASLLIIAGVLALSLNQLSPWS
ncbi:MAG: hypothetical protein M0Q54_04710 [Pigmentiphaga sp.]|nr:hypothetical protein [Pigmentiphaga sp.]